MSSPNVAGLAALVKQYLMNDERFTDLPEEHMREMINTLLMSTAIPASYEDEFFGELPYSPRQQGAGMANVNNAVRTNAYLSVPGMTRPKLELGDDPEETGVYELVFNVHNFGSETLSYNIEPTVMTEFTDYDDNAIPYMAGTPNPLYPEVETNWDGDMVVVPAGETKQVVVKLTLSEGDRELFTYCYENGMYVDGFVFLKSLNEDGIDLSMPFLGFYGDWTKAPQLDHGFYWDTLLDETTTKRPDTRTRLPLRWTNSTFTIWAITCTITLSIFRTGTLFPRTATVISIHSPKSIPASCATPKPSAIPLRARTERSITRWN